MKGNGANERRVTGPGAAGSETAAARPPHVRVLERRIDAVAAEMKSLWPEGVEWDAVPQEAMSRWHKLMAVGFRRLCARREILEGGALKAHTRAEQAKKLDRLPAGGVLVV